MKIYRNNEIERIENSVLTIGMFDGVHLGHKLLLNQLISLAEAKQKTSVVLTLWPPPYTLFKKDHPLLNITTPEEKMDLLAQTGIQHLVVLPFTLDTARLTSKEFIESILHQKIGITSLLLGFNHQFGSDKQSDVHKIREFALPYNIEVLKAEELKLDNNAVSSSNIRQNLKEGNVEEANRMLDYDYFMRGRVVSGSEIARKIGFPTANIEISDGEKIVPQTGVYAVYVRVGDKILSGMLNIGYKPTFYENLNKPVIEVHILNFDETIYNQEITIYFKKRIRDELKFSSADELIKQLETDRNHIQNFLNNNKIKLFGM